VDGEALHELRVHRRTRPVRQHERAAARRDGGIAQERLAHVSASIDAIPARRGSGEDVDAPTLRALGRSA
jgi:hypothetical protein